MKRSAIVGALALTTVLVLQDYFQGDGINLIKIAVWLLLGALVGMGVTKWLSRFR